MTTPAKSDKEILSVPLRWLELLFVAGLLLLFAFFLIHQLSNTGFFTAKFGVLEMLCLYGPLLLAITPPALRALTGRRNPARPLDAASSLVTALAAVWLLNVFPFSFAHFADALPESLRFIFAWITDDIGKIPLVLQIIIGPISAIVTIWQYLSIRGQESTSLSQRRTT